MGRLPSIKRSLSDVKDFAQVGEQVFTKTKNAHHRRGSFQNNSKGKIIHSMDDEMIQCKIKRKHSDDMMA